MSATRDSPPPPTLAAMLGLAVLVLLQVPRGSLAGPVESVEDTPVVHIAQGDLVGVVQKSEGGSKFMAFMGIPYAAPPTGELRFKDPRPVRSWEGVLKAQSVGKMCMQSPRSLSPQRKGEEKRLRMTNTNMNRLVSWALAHISEDCLFLNVYTPVKSLPVETPLPVLVFIHGGAFIAGSADRMMYGPEYLMDKDVVLVTINYRLGPFGFLSTNTTEAPGNAGLKDQRLALRWVQDNIRAFGGDPGKVTIYGESAGSYSVHMHVLSPSTKGLFRAAILSSAMGPNQLMRDVADPVTWSRRLGEGTGADAETVEDQVKLLQHLRAVPAWVIVNSKLKASVAGKGVRSVKIPFGPVVEPPGSEEPILSRDPNDILRSGDFNKVPMMVGMNNKEGSIFTPINDDDKLADLVEDPSLLFTRRLNDSLDDAQRQALLKKIQNVYFGGQPISKDAMPGITDVHGDVMLGHGIYVASRWHAKYATVEAPVYIYLLTLDALNVMSMMLGVGVNLGGAGHGDDLGYVFKMRLVDGVPVADQARVDRGRARMLDLITNFVKDSNPTPSKTATVDVEWPPAVPGKEQYLEIGDELVVRENILAERMALWDEALKDVFKDPLYDYQ